MKALRLPGHEGLGIAIKEIHFQGSLINQSRPSSTTAEGKHSSMGVDSSDYYKHFFGGTVLVEVQIQG